MPESDRSIHRRRPVVVFYAYRITQSAAFTVPIFILFFRSRGLSFVQIGLIEAVYTVTVLVCETPTGYIGDRIGHRRSMLFGTCLSAIGALGYAAAHTFPAFVVVAGLRGIAGTFRSGATEAWLYELLGRIDTQERFTAVSGRASAATTGIHGLAAVCGSVLYGVDHLLPWVLEAAVIGAGVPLLVTLPDVDTAASDRTAAAQPTATGPTGRQDRPGPRSILRHTRRTLTTRALGAFVLYTALLFGVVNTLEMFIQPVSVSIVGLAPESLGGLYAGLTVLAAVLASRSGWIKRVVGIGRWFGVVPIALAVALLVVPAVPWVALPVFAFHRAVAAVSRPLAGQYINDHAPSASRATVLSSASMVRSLVTAPLNTIGGAIATTLTLPLTLAALGGLLLTGALGMLLWRFPVVDGTIRDRSAG
ncbi:MAG: MFS transporter [Halobacteriales archaeon]|nr:MFS transporter [Halobacteriales archaeon]